MQTSSRTAIRGAEHGLFWAVYSSIRAAWITTLDVRCTPEAVEERTSRQVREAPLGDIAFHRGGLANRRLTVELIAMDMPSARFC